MLLAKTLCEPPAAIIDSLDPGVVASTYTLGPKISFGLLSLVSVVSILVGAVAVCDIKDYLFCCCSFGSFSSLESTFDSSYFSA